MITVPSFKILEMLPNQPSEGEYALDESEGKIYKYENKKWNPANIGKGNFKVSLQDINKGIFAQLTPMTDEKLRDVHSQVYKFLGDTMKDCDNDYWALICWERKYITIFHNDSNLKSKKDCEELSDVFMEIIEYLGDIKDVSDNGHDALEIWITEKNKENPETYCYLFFNYKNGVVEGVA